MGRARELAAASALALAGATPSLALAQDEVTVRGTSSGDFTSRASERDAPRELTDAASLLEPLPGVHVRRFGGDDSFATLSIRGSTSSEVAVVLAGVPLTGGADPSLDLSTLPLWPGATARVHRSFAPAALGPGSLGGTLVLDPPRPTSPLGTDVWAAAGSFGEARTRVGTVSALGDARVAAAVSASRSDNDFSYLNPQDTALEGRDVFVPFANAGHADANGIAAVSVPVAWSAAKSTPDGALTVTVLAQDRHQELPGTAIAPTPYARLDSDRELAAMELTGPLGEGAWRARGWGRRDGLHLDDVPGSAALGPTHADQAIVAAGGAAGWRGPVAEGMTIDAQIDGSGERYVPGVFEGDVATPPGATRASVGGAVDAAWRAAKHLVVAGSGRVDGWSDAASDGTREDELRPTGHVGIEVPLEGVSLASHAGATSRPPSFTERYGDRGTFIGDPGLVPESAWTVDAGGRGAARLGANGAARGALEVVGFATWARDLITFVPVGAGGRLKATNIGEARLAGVEVDARGQAGPVELRASYTGLVTANASACTATVGRCDEPVLPGRPEHDVVADAILHAAPATLRVGVDAVSGMFADLAQTVPVPARALLSAGARLDVTPQVRIAVDGRNLLDARTGTYAGAAGPVTYPIGDSYDFPLPGRSVLVSARFSDALFDRSLAP
ncbi:MAG TPA: TonB-dependent receptor [Polyangiaceae bacterium]|jgi:hypothetical protein|nr:TonB-dependent receptor [Polyangiaceae bacterium]